jgi:hypothetical protein
VGAHAPGATAGGVLGTAGATQAMEELLGAKVAIKKGIAIIRVHSSWVRTQDRALNISGQTIIIQIPLHTKLNDISH